MGEAKRSRGLWSGGKRDGEITSSSGLVQYIALRHVQQVETNLFRLD